MSVPAALELPQPQRRASPLPQPTGSGTGPPRTQPQNKIEQPQSCNLDTPEPERTMVSRGVTKAQNFVKDLMDGGLPATIVAKRMKNDSLENKKNLISHILVSYRSKIESNA